MHRKILTLGIGLAATFVAGCGSELQPRTSQSAQARSCSQSYDCMESSGTTNEADGLSPGSISPNVKSEDVIVAGNGDAGGDDTNDQSTSIKNFAIDAIPFAISGTFTLNWQAAEGAEQYQADIALDPECSESVASMTTTIPTAKFEDVTAGNHYVCVTAEAGDATQEADNHGMAIEIRKGWVRLADLPEGVAFFPSLGYRDGKLHVYGGRWSRKVDGKRYSTRGYTYDFTTDSWESWEHAPTEELHTSYTVPGAWNGKEFLWVNTADTVTVFNPETMSTVSHPDLPLAVPAELYSVQLTYLPTTQSYLATSPGKKLYHYNQASGDWELWGDNNNPDYTFRQFSVMDDQLFSFGGYDSDRKEHHSELWRVSLDTEEWIQVEGQDHPEDYYRGVTTHVVNDQILVMGGYDFVPLKYKYTKDDLNPTISTYDPTNNSWTHTTPEMNPMSLASSQVTVDGIGVVSLGGNKTLDVKNPEMSNEVYMYYP